MRDDAEHREYEYSHELFFLFAPIPENKDPDDEGEVEKAGWNAKFDGLLQEHVVRMARGGERVRLVVRIGEGEGVGPISRERSTLDELETSFPEIDSLIHR